MYDIKTGINPNFDAKYANYSKYDDNYDDNYDKKRIREVEDQNSGSKDARVDNKGLRDLN